MGAESNQAPNPSAEAPGGKMVNKESPRADIEIGFTFIWATQRTNRIAVWLKLPCGSIFIEY